MTEPRQRDRWPLVVPDPDRPGWVPAPIWVMPVAEHEALREAGAMLRAVARRPIESSIESIDAAIAAWDEAAGHA